MSNAERVVFLIKLVVLVGIIEVHGVCHNGWIRDDDSCYLIEDLQKLNWADANAHCESMNTHLIVVESQTENDFIKHELQKMHPGREDQFWTAGNDLDTENTWVWGNTTDPFEVSFWHPGEPNQAAGEEDCLTYYTRYNFDWNDEHCEKSMAFICEMEFEVSFWHPGEPNQAAGEEDCLTYYTRYNFDWNDEHCEKSMAFICEMEDYVDSGGFLVG